MEKYIDPHLLKDNADSTHKEGVVRHLDPEEKKAYINRMYTRATNEEIAEDLGITADEVAQIARELRSRITRISVTKNYQKIRHVSISTHTHINHPSA